MRAWIVAGILVSSLSGAAAAAEPLPEGDQGIAAKYPNDAGIASDPEVIFADDFEGYADASELSQSWDALFQNDQTRIATEPEYVFAGSRSLEFTVPQQDAELSNSASKFVSPERDVLFLRYYSRFLPPFDVVGSSHNGASISAHYFINGQATPGVPADGTNKFLANLENWRGEPETPSPGLQNIYIYHPLQRSQWGDHFFPSGTVLPYSNDPFDFGPDFVPRPEFSPELDRWYCYEFMVKANTPGLLDGRIAFWIDGALAGDFQNLRLRDVDDLKIDRFGLDFHIGSNPNGETKKWYDNVVAAGSYIGPLYVPGAETDTGTTGTDDTTATGDPGTSTGGTTSSTGGSTSASSGSSDGGGESTTTGAGTSTGSSASSSDTGGLDGGGDESGCACRAGDAAPTAPLLLVVLGLVGRRRRRPGLR